MMIYSYAIFYGSAERGDWPSVMMARRQHMLKNKKDIKKLEDQIYYIKMRLEQFSEEHFNQDISDHWETLKKLTAENMLRTMPIDTISTLEKGMPINALMSENLQTIYDVHDKTERELMRVDGVGVKSAEAIVDAVARIKESVYEQASPRINPDDLSTEDETLLASIFKKWKLLTKAESLQEEANSFHGMLEPAMKAAKERRGFLGSLFQSKSQKIRIQQAFDELNQVEVRQQLDKMKQELTEVSEFTVDRDELIQHFVDKNASYYTEIEKVTYFKQQDMAESLPRDIVELVHGYPLDTTGLMLDLRGYQTFGAKYGLHYKRTLLGDEMGLGKTIQALAMINHLSQQDQKYAIVVCPLSLLANWKREIQQHSSLNVFVFHGNHRDEAFAKWQEQKGILLTTYEHTLRMNVDELERLNMLVVDEAHYVKNPNAKRSQSVYHLASVADYVLFMSGTPLENRLEEMKQLISVLQPAIADQLTQELHLLHPNEFKRTVATVYLRRNRKDVLAELPELEMIPQWLNFGEKESEIYAEAVRSGQLMLMRRAAWMGGSPDKSPKLEKLMDICNEARDNGHKVLIFSFFRDVIDIIHQHLEGRTFEPITGDVSNSGRQDIIDAFTKAPAGSVLISQITAGGVGLNIQAANIVILCEPQWKPSTEEQAISRAYRMGQSRDVVVYRLLTEDSIDVSMLEVLGQKAGLFDLYARESEVASIAMNEQREAEDASIKQKVLELEKERLEQKAI